MVRYLKSNKLLHILYISICSMNKKRSLRLSILPKNFLKIVLIIRQCFIDFNYTFLHITLSI